MASYRVLLVSGLTLCALYQGVPARSQVMGAAPRQQPQQSQQWSAPYSIHPPQRRSYIMPEVGVAEREDAYQIQVQLGHPSDEKSVTIKVKAHHIQVTGKFPLRATGSGEVIGKSSFSKSFATQHTVDPNRINRTVRNNILYITISKQTPATVYKELPPLKPGGVYSGTQGSPAPYYTDTPAPSYGVPPQAQPTRQEASPEFI
ncbi:MAG: Hsp20/alpha crystallin family protein [Vampirovibrio sp.]|nr:Hsp20/alpha crystallin family protein [Vampirovibrio sp.]